MQKILKNICIGCIGFFVGVVLGGYWMGHKYCLRLMDSQKLIDKHLNMVRLYDVWMMTKQNGSSIAQYLTINNIHTIAIYGMSYMGIRLFYELKNSSICVKYGIDCEPRMKIPGLAIYHINDLDNVEVDAIIVTAIFAFDSIKKDLEYLKNTKIIALDEILYDLIQ